MHIVSRSTSYTSCYFCLLMCLGSSVVVVCFAFLFGWPSALAQRPLLYLTSPVLILFGTLLFVGALSFSFSCVSRSFSCCFLMSFTISFSVPTLSSPHSSGGTFFSRFPPVDWFFVLWFSSASLHSAPSPTRVTCVVRFAIPLVLSLCAWRPPSLCFASHLSAFRIGVVLVVTFLLRVCCVPLGCACVCFPLWRCGPISMFVSPCCYAPRTAESLCFLVVHFFHGLVYFLPSPALASCA